MKFIVAAVVLFVTIYGVFGQTGHICDFYSNELSLNNSALMTDIVSTFVGA